MSRRKQSNPKPIKRQAGEDGSDSEMANHLDTKKVEENMDQSNASLSSDEENKPMEQNDIKNIVHCKVEGPREITSPYDNSTSFPNGIWKNNLFPSDVLSLRKVEESEFIQTGIAWSILANIALQKGSTIGPYRGELVSLSSIKPGQLVLQFQGPSGEFAFIKVMEEGGEWLTLLKPADRQMAHNTSVYFEEGRIWCEMVLDLAAGTELVASFTVNGERQGSSPEGEKSSSPSSVSPCETATIKEEPKSNSPKATPKATPEPRSSAHFKSVIIPPNHAALIYGCPFCGVRFSSARTLEAHLSFYCSKKPPDFVSIQQQLSQQQQQATGAVSEKEPEAINKDNFGKESPADVDKEKTAIKKEPELSTNKRSAEQKSNDLSDSASESESPPAKSPKTGQLYKCPLCSYTADKVSSLNRHRRIHNRGGDDVVEKLPVVLSSHSDMFCKDCNIQFSSMNTYRAHKEFYCKGRQKVGQDQSTDGNSSGEESPKAQDSPQIVTPTSQAMATLLASNPALLASNQQLLQQMALIPHPFLLGSPEVISLASQMTRPVIPHGMQGFMKSPDEATSPINQISPGHNSDKSKLSETKNLMELSSQDVPLDLSTCKPKKISESIVESDENSEQPENLVIKKEPKSPSPGPSQNVLDTKSSPKTQSLSPGDGTSTVQVPLTPINIPGLMTPVLPFNQIQFVKNKPIPPRQPVSRCVECNIVFYKHENFLIHKEHYCSGRQIKDTSDENMVTADENRKQESPDSSPKADLLTNQAQYKENPHPKTVPVPSPNQIVTTPKTPTEICYRYYCIPCKIKFSSAGTLKAHKEFYCPHGQATETLVVKEPVENESNTSSPNSSEEGNSFKCSTCQSEFMSARLLKLHFCNGSATQTPLLRCPYCDYVTQTETRLSEHMKVHIPTKAFKCTICGYRGNTARGMRMHGKMHIDNGEEFTDDNMVEYEEPPLIPVQRNGVCDKGPVDVESELIRLKNEPYKRRRSRKSFEKTENFSAFLNHAVLPRVCAACGQTFTDVNSFLIHLQMHEMAALEAVKNLKCEHCNFVAESLKNLLQHLHAKHPEQLPTTSKPSSASPNRSENGERSRSQSRSPMRSDSGDDRSDSGESSNSHSSLCENSVRKEKTFAGQNGDFKGKTMNLPLKISLKEEIVSNESSSDEESKILKIKKEPDDRNSPSPRQCTAVNSKVNRLDEKDLNPNIYDNSEQVSPRIQDQKSSPKISIPSQNFSTGLLSPRESSPREPSPRQPSPRQSMTSPMQPIFPNISSIKREPMSPKLQFDCEPNAFATVKSESKSPTSLDRSPLKLRTHSSPTTSPKLPTTKGILTATMIQNFPLYNPALLSLYQLPGVSHGVTPLVSMPALTPSSIVPPSGAISPDKQGPKYCKDCDIKFTYLSTFLTHKKFYCRARTGGDLSHSATA
ncbi:hypothetical protein ACJMK2_010769 [Sinanodonta woodiana]|uniref:Zinc finger protein ush n=1 Tax=Sinanodonta woodiana TaxID=1069815 RepID=A0ABD3VIW8_SINWO